MSSEGSSRRGGFRKGGTGTRGNAALSRSARHPPLITGRLQTAAVGRQLQVNRSRANMLEALDLHDLHSHADITTSSDKVASWLLNPQQQQRYKQSTQQPSRPAVPQQPSFTGAWAHQRESLRKESRPRRRWLPLLHPEGAFFGRWSLFMGIWDATYTSFIIPISIANVSYPTDWNPIVVLDMLGGLVFLFDIAINFRTGFEIFVGKTRRVIMKPKAIAKYYILYDTFFVDLLCVLPLPFVSEALKVLLVLRLLRMWRFFAMVQVRGGIQVLYKLFSSGTIFALNIVYTAAVMINFMACLLVAVAHLEGMHTSWLAHVGGHDFSDASKPLQMVAAIYFAVGTMAGAGYGDITAQTTVEQLVCAFVMCSGCVFLGFLVGTFSYLINEASAEGRSAAAFRKKLDSVEAWCRARRIPKNLQGRIKDYYLEVLQTGSEDDDLAQLTELPTALRDEVVAFLTKDVLEHSPIFGVLGKHERRYLARRMVPLTLPMGHDLFREGDNAECMYILQEGSMVMLRHTQDIQQVQAPAFVGELVVLAPTWQHARYRETTCRANTSCLLWELKMTDLHQVVHVFPHVMEDLRLAFLGYLKDAIANARMQEPDKQLPFAQLDQEALDDLQVFGSTTITPSGSLILTQGSGFAPPLDTRGVSNASMEALAPDDVLVADAPAGDSPTAQGSELRGSGKGLRVASDPVLRRGSHSGSSGILKRDGQPSSARRISFHQDAEVPRGGDDNQYSDAHSVVDVARLQRASADAALTEPLLSHADVASPARSVPGRVHHSFLQSPLFTRRSGEEGRRGSEQLGRLEELQQAVLGTLGGGLERRSADGGLQLQQQPSRGGGLRRDTFSQGL